MCPRLWLQAEGAITHLSRIMARCLSYWSYFFLGILPLQMVCTESVKDCVVRREVADCSHLKLTQIPPDLPTNITTLNLTHNQLKRLPAANLTRYNQLITLDGGFNSISKLEPELCQRLPLLKVLNLQHNELSQITDAMFAHCTGLMELYLKFNSFQKISNNPFKNLKDLCILDVSHSGLSSTKLGTQVQLENLQELLLTNNKIHTLKNEDFDYLGNSSLRQLDLSSNPLKEWLKCLEYLNMEDNSLLGITTNMFTGLTNLKHTTLSNSFANLQTLTNVTFSSLAHSPLLTLNLTRNKISHIESGAFSWLGHLEVLDLGLNEINQELTGQEWKGLENIVEIYLSYNKYLTLTSGSFASVPSLRRLMLRRVACKHLDISPSPFHPLRNLTILDLSNNNIANINDEMLKGLDQLEILDLQHNNLARLWKHANPGGPVLFLKGLSHLHILNLESNGFDEIPADVFKGLSQLRVIYLGLNNLNLLPDSLFDDQTTLKSLSLQKNLITSVEKSVFGPAFQNLNSLDMSFNPFDCTCESLAWFASWLNGTHTNIEDLPSHYLCNTPPQYHATPVMLFDISPCKDSAPFKLLFVINTSFLFTLIFVVLLVHFQGWRIAFYWNVTIHRVLGFKEIDHQAEKHDYSAYVVHAQEDARWIWKHFCPMEEKDHSLRFCLEERDFEAGTPELEAIVNSIKRSRKIIFVITRNLLKDPLCKRFKVHHAVQQAIEQNLDSIILIFLEDIPDYKLNHALCLRRGMFRSHCILYWPAQKERVHAFYQKLQVALGMRNRAQ
ncbi:toll-like receptor 3 isoform X5 [Phascolarctos cinereus]|uniref:Toll-like receptor 3 n=1 Tax=Phascolarctos cinereus TaxID=38626 RepID=A0A6P5M4B3_PHACI|nr:toll-like receptor 3 isoform X5 [Phascolarctos cinereus]